MWHQVSGVPIHASYWPARVRRLRHEQPGIRQWVGLPELVAESLVGSRLVSRSMASGTGLLDRATGTWSSELMNALDLAPESLAPIVEDDEALGPLTPPAARRWPQLAKAAWFAPWGDGSCGNVGLGATSPGHAALMVGTSGALRAAIADPVLALPAGLFAYRLGSGSIVGGQLSEGGGVLAWASQLLGRSRTSLERAARAIPADGHGLTILPYPFGERSLGYHEAARAIVAGLHAGTDGAALYRALLEAIAFGFAAVDERLTDLLGVQPTITASGGARARSPLLPHMLADGLGREILVAPSYEASRHGAALLALRGVGLIGDLGSAPPPRSRLVRADPKRVRTYRAARARQRTLYDATLAQRVP
jgi:gluconokinase